MSKGKIVESYVGVKAEILSNVLTNRSSTRMTLLFFRGICNGIWCSLQQRPPSVISHWYQQHSAQALLNIVSRVMTSPLRVKSRDRAVRWTRVSDTSFSPVPSPPPTTSAVHVPEAHGAWPGGAGWGGAGRGGGVGYRSVSGWSGSVRLEPVLMGRRRPDVVSVSGDDARSAGCHGNRLGRCACLGSRKLRNRLRGQRRCGNRRVGDGDGILVTQEREREDIGKNTWLKWIAFTLVARYAFGFESQAWHTNINCS